MWEVRWIVTDVEPMADGKRIAPRFIA